MFKNPELLRKRLNAKEKENEQKQVLLFSGLMFISGFIIAGLNFRYSSSAVFHIKWAFRINVWYEYVDL